MSGQDAKLAFRRAAPVQRQFRARGIRDARVLAGRGDAESPAASGLVSAVARPTQHGLMTPGAGSGPGPGDDDLAALLIGTDSWVVE